MEKLNLVKDCLKDIKKEINKLIKENGDEMYEGVFDMINKLENDDSYWVNYIKELEKDYDDDDDGFINMILVDSVDRKLMELFGKKFKENLIKLGYKYDKEDDCWDIKSPKESFFKYNKLTCYGVIWDYWYELDTDVRESLGDIFEMECNK